MNDHANNIKTLSIPMMGMTNMMIHSITNENNDEDEMIMNIFHGISPLILKCEEPTNQKQNNSNNSHQIQCSDSDLDSLKGQVKKTRQGDPNQFPRQNSIESFFSTDSSTAVRPSPPVRKKSLNFSHLTHKSMTRQSIRVATMSDYEDLLRNRFSQDSVSNDESSWIDNTSISSSSSLDLAAGEMDLSNIQLLNEMNRDNHHGKDQHHVSFFSLGSLKKHNGRFDNRYNSGNLVKVRNVCIKFQRNIWSLFIVGIFMWVLFLYVGYYHVNGTITI